MSRVMEFQQVPVPHAFVGDVYGLVARLMADNGAATHDSEEAMIEIVAPEEEVPEYPTAEMVRRIYEESHETHRRLLKALTTRPDEWVSSEELAEALQLSGGRASLAGTLGALGKRANHRYKGQKPFISAWDAHTGQAKHLMTTEVAKVINAL